MNALKCFCYPFKICCPTCCPCLEDKTKRTPNTGQSSKTKRTKKSDKTEETDISEKKRIKEKKETILKISKAFSDESTHIKEFVIPDHFKSIKECRHSFGIIDNEVLGQGSFGCVYKAKDKSGEVMAVKIIELKGSLYESSVVEIAILEKTRKKQNENIIEVKNNFILKDSIDKRQFCFIFMEFANGGSLLDRMKDNGQIQAFNEKTVKDFFKQIVNGLIFLHDSGIAHKDLKLQNILIVKKSNGKEVIKITDFGLSGIRYDPSTGTVIKDMEFVGTVEYMSPQVFRLYVYFMKGKKVSQLREYNPFSADIWALGVCLYVMISIEYPFTLEDNSFENMSQMYNNMKKSKYDLKRKVIKNYSSECLQMIRELLEPNAYIRISLSEIITHKWLQN